MKDHDRLSAASGASKYGMRSGRQLYRADPRRRIIDGCFIEHPYGSEVEDLLCETIQDTIDSFVPMFVSAFIVSFSIRQIAEQSFRKEDPGRSVRIMIMIQHFRRNIEQEPFFSIPEEMFQSAAAVMVPHAAIRRILFYK